MGPIPIPKPISISSPHPLFKYVLSFYHDQQHHSHNNNNLHQPRSQPPLSKRYDAISIPATYGRLSDSPSPGVVVGIILGSVAGFIFLLYLIYLALSSGRRFSSATEMSESVDVGPMRRPPSRRMREVVVEEEIVDSHGRRSGRWVRRGARGGRSDRIVVEESVTSAEDSNIIEVIEEPSSVEGSHMGRPRSGRGGYRRGDPYEISEYGSSR
ncbi:hypothetical protein FE257_006006 [Aspergillus nanangensis]|uniref:Uncharacterized protein n=1 Tax=Aspergillus nanangensis TaxID=2582783 RepID=A0AAD4CPK2_ASPNN|nr:hypothetical protein FE257_006006 [Aspergillus nanangensis]